MLGWKQMTNYPFHTLKPKNSLRNNSFVLHFRVQNNGKIGTLWSCLLQQKQQHCFNLFLIGINQNVSTPYHRDRAWFKNPYINWKLWLYTKQKYLCFQNSYPYEDDVKLTVNRLLWFCLVLVFEHALYMCILRSLWSTLVGVHTKTYNNNNLNSYCEF